MAKRLPNATANNVAAAAAATAAANVIKMQFELQPHTSGWLGGCVAVWLAGCGGTHARKSYPVLLPQSIDRLNHSIIRLSCVFNFIAFA